MPPFKELHYLNDLGRVERAATPRRRDERDVLFLERLQKLTAEPSLSLRNYARLFEPKASLLSGDITPGYSTLTDDIIGRVVAFFPELKVIFLAADPDKPSGRRRADHNSWAGKEKLPLTNQARSHIAQFFKKELKACATQLGGPARLWPARYGFSLLWLIIDLLDDFDLFFWCNWVG